MTTMLRKKKRNWQMHTYMYVLLSVVIDIYYLHTHALLLSGRAYISCVVYVFHKLN